MSTYTARSCILVSRERTLQATILALASIVVLLPRLRLLHATAKCGPVQQRSLGGSHRFVSDASVDADAAMRKACAASNFKPVVLRLVAPVVRSNSVSSAVLPEGRRLVIWPLRRLPSRADSEYPLI